MVRVRVLGEEFLGRLDAHARAHHGAIDLVIHISPQVPREGLQPCDRVGRLPRLRLVVGVLESENCILQAQFGSPPVVEVGVHAIGVRLKNAQRSFAQQVDFLLRNATPPECSQERVGRHLRFTEHFR